MNSDTGTTGRAELDRRLQAVLSDHPVSFALLFGSKTTDSDRPNSDIDIAIEFEGLRPSDEGYSDVFLATYTAVDDAVDDPVDLVDVHTMPARFAASALSNGRLLVGSASRRAELRETVGDDASVDSRDAVARVEAALERMRSDG